MRRIVLIGLALLCLLVQSAWAQTATPGQSLAWEHPTASAELVTRFETNYDGAGYVDVGMVAHPTLADTFYAPIPALMTGAHSVVVRACNTNGCSADSSPAFSFSMVAGTPTVVAAGSILIIQTPAP